MSLLPQFKKLTSPEDLATFSATYARCSGLPIPQSYLANSRVYAYFSQDEMIGGFILGQGPEYRTIKLFANTQNQAALYSMLEDKGQATELCCFWIARSFRTKTLINIYIWMCMAYVLRFRSESVLLFGTNSQGLAKLYSTTPHSVLINNEQVKSKDCHIFLAKSNVALRGISEIVAKKLKRVFKIKKRRSAKATLFNFLSLN